MTTDLTVGKTSQKLFWFSIPLLLSVAFQQLYQMADSIIVGRFAETVEAGELALAAVGASYPITQLFVAVATGINIGTGVLVSQLFGAKRYLRMKTAISTALLTTTTVALLLTLIPQMGRFYMVDRSSRVTILQTLEQCANFLVPHFFGRKVETVFILCLDAKCKLLCCKELGEGGPNSTGVSIRKIVETAIGVNAATVVLAHNHPSGLALPSDADKLATKRLKKLFTAVDIELRDHLIFVDEDMVSMRDSGLLDCL